MRKLLLLSLVLNVLVVGAGVWAVQRLGGLHLLYLRFQTRGLGAEYEHLRDQYERLPVDSNAIVMLGNSLTAYGRWTELLGDPRVRNRGIPGDYVLGVLERLPPILQGRPAKIFLLVGVNDLPYQDDDTLLDHYERLLDAIARSSPRTEVFVQSLLPVNNDVNDLGIPNERIRRVNERLRALAESRRLPFLDLHAAFADAEGKLPAHLTLDGIHLNGAGYLLWRDLLAPYISSEKR
ncbi:MAG: hypothetical protein D6765_02640 [Bacteroidetes bacterium]|nr:MAG: hypothetical protein D6765_02640 [Bacteroidota bacterium]